jgi:hypothetical protein
MKTEFIVWGYAPEKDFEQILYANSKTHERARQVCDILEAKHGCKNTRVQVLNFSDTENLFIKSLNL